MLMNDVNRYLELRTVLGAKLRGTKRELKNFAKYAADQGDQYIQVKTAAGWAEQAPSPYARSRRMHRVVQLAKFLKAENPKHEVPSLANYQHRYVRPTPYIYKESEVTKILMAFNEFKKTNDERKRMYQIIVSTLKSTGLRISELLNLKLSDVEDGVLIVRETKFGKSRLVPMHPTTSEAIYKYVEQRQELKLGHNYLFFSRKGKKLSSKTLQHNFREAVNLAKIAPSRKIKPRIHDLRHTFATNALQSAPTDRDEIEKHFIAISTYLGHVDIRATYWYLESTPGLMNGMASQTEEIFGGVQ